MFFFLTKTLYVFITFRRPNIKVQQQHNSEWKGFPLSSHCSIAVRQMKGSQLTLIGQKHCDITETGSCVSWEGEHLFWVEQGRNLLNTENINTEKSLHSQIQTICLSSHTSGQNSG